ncbi:MAG: hypothetical protein R2879_00815 [Saprospiraceae bacterium]
MLKWQLPTCGRFVGGSEYVILMSSGNNGSGGAGNTDFSIQVENAANFFDWEYNLTMLTKRDRFGYSINGGGVTWITTGTATSQCRVQKYCTESGVMF